jgi:peptide/nickel transport system substrate-binding protein
MSLLFCVGALASCGGAPSGAGDGDLVIALESAPIHLDPRLGSDQASGRAYELMLSGLVTKDVDGNYVPELAESWELLDQGKKYRFHLRSGVRFHDGRAFSSKDVAWTFNSMIDGIVVSPKRGGFPQLERVEAVDDSTVDFLLSEPWGALLDNVTCWVGIVPEGALPEELARNPVGTGPYRLLERRPDRLTFEAYEDYWGERPKIPRVVLREVPDATVRALEMKKGSVQLIINGLSPDVVQDFVDDPKYHVQIDPGSSYQYLAFNLEDPILQVRDVRRAIALAIDRAEILATLYRGLGALTETAIRPGHWARNEDLPAIAYDPAEAARLLDRAGFADPDGDGPAKRFALVYKTSTDETAVLQAQIIQSMLARVGIDVAIRSFEFATFYNDVKAGNFQMFSLAWTGIVDPDIYGLILHSQRIPPAGANRGHYRNPEFDRLIDLGASFAEPESRRPFYLEAQEILVEDLPYVSLLLKANVAIMPCTLEGYRNYPSGELYGVPDLRWGAGPDGCPAPGN